jgi:ERCC4-type nuclease
MSSEDYKIELWVDQRERHVLPYFELEEGKSIEIPIVLKTLSAGDYAVIYKNHIIMLIERKSWKDLAATFTDKDRKFNYEKMLEEREKFNCKVFYLIEGKKPHGYIQNISIEYLEAHLDHLLFDHNITPIYSESVEKTPERLFKLIRNYKSAHTKPFDAIKEKLKDVQIHDASLSLSAIKRKSDDAVDYAIWKSIEGVTELTYYALKELNITLHGILCGQYTVNDLMAAKYPTGNLVGEKKLSKILASAMDISTHAKILSQIPNVSEHRAKHILTKFQLPSIILGTVQEKDIADIVIPSQSSGTGRRLGNNIAGGIIKFLSVKN